MNIARNVAYLARIVGSVIALICGSYSLADIASENVSIEDVVSQALTTEPAIHSLDLKASAQENLKEAAKRLPDPMVRAGILNIPLDSFALNREPMTQTLIGVRQTIPAIGSRIASSMKHGHLSQVLIHQKSLQMKNTTLAARAAWLEAHYQRHAVDLTAQASQLLESFADVVRARYAAGDELQLAVLAAELELSRLQSRLIDTKRSERQTLYELQRLVGVEHALSIALDLPKWDVVPPRADLQESLELHPRIQAADSLIAAESATRQLYETALKPEWHIDLSYGVRNGENLDGNPRSDFASATVSFSIPFVEKRKHQLRLVAAHSNEDSARFVKNMLMRDMSTEIDVAYSEWDRLTERLNLLNDTIVTQSHNHAQAALKAYQNKEGSFTDVLLSYVGEVDSILEQHRVKIDRLKMWATIDSLNGSTK